MFWAYFLVTFSIAPYSSVAIDQQSESCFYNPTFFSLFQSRSDQLPRFPPFLVSFLPFSSLDLEERLYWHSF